MGWGTCSFVMHVIFLLSEYQGVLPYFSESDLVSKYAHMERIRYTYYLNQGRPSFAFVSFLAEELDSGRTTIAPKRFVTFFLITNYFLVSDGFVNDDGRM